jgi:hypothetical protein
MKHWMVTKYDPAYRDISGAYRRDDWTSIDDIGRTFCGVVLTMADYLKTEDCYVSTALHFAHEAGVSDFVLSEIELRNSNLSVSENMVVTISEVSELVREILRSHLWCKLESKPHFYLHFGYDYYMYVGNKVDLPESVQSARDCGLFVEEYVSPYFRWD